jgi:hypothetical protein
MGAPPAGSVTNPRRSTKWRWWNAREVQFYTTPREEERKAWDLAPASEQIFYELALVQQAPVGGTPRMSNGERRRRPLSIDEDEDGQTEGPLVKRRRLSDTVCGCVRHAEEGSRTPVSEEVRSSPAFAKEFPSKFPTSLKARNHAVQV